MSSSSMDVRSPRENISRKHTLGKKVMGNMMDTLLLKNLTFKLKGRAIDILILTSPTQVSDIVELALMENEESPGYLGDRTLP